MVVVLHYYTKRSNLVLGMVITSALPWEKFAQVNGLSAEFNPTNSVWCPCDGTSIEGSELNRLGESALNKAPDLRGVFIRGRNAFKASDAGDSVPASQRDPDGLRPDISRIQYSAIAGHSHDLDLGGAGDLSGTGGVVALGDAQKKHLRVTTLNNTNSRKEQEVETRPVNAALYYYIRINR